MSDLKERGVGDGRETQKDEAKEDLPSDKSDTGNQEFEAVGAVAASESLGAPADVAQALPDVTVKSKPKVKEWSPNEKFLEQLTAMGISKSAAVKALYQTKNSSAEMAVSWLFENPQSDLCKESAVPVGGESDEEEEEDPSCMFKMVFVVNSSLGMKLGKTCAQVAHATLGIHQLMMQNESSLGDGMVNWLRYGQAKIVLRGDDTQHLLDLKKRATDLNLPCYLVQDAGRTQIPAGSFTVLSIFGPILLIDQITGSLRLL